MSGLTQQDYLLVSEATSIEEFRAGLIAFSHKLDFGQVGATLLEGPLTAVTPRVRSVCNTPDAFLRVAKDLDQSVADPVMNRLTHGGPLPFAYNQDLYVEAGAGHMWDVQAQFGYKVGIAVAIQAGQQRFFLGLDRHAPLPSSSEKMTRLLADLQLMAVHAYSAAQRLMVLPTPPGFVPATLTRREQEILEWTMLGKSARDIAQILEVSDATVNFHVSNVLKKLDVTSKHLAVLKAIRLGLLNPK